MRHHVLVVDDDPGVAHLLWRLIAAEGHDVTIARDGCEALARIAERTPDLILLDLDMPRLSGFEVCRQVKADALTRLVPVVIVTGRSAGDAKMRAWELGADDFLPKPFQAVEVVARCRSLLRVKRLVDELDSAQAVVFAFARAVEAKHAYTQGHAERVSQYALAMAERLGLTETEREVLRQGAVLHDVGKICIPDAILDKPGPLTSAEFELVRQHPAQGMRIVEPLRSVRAVVPLIRWHHERLDGSGYPDRLAGDSIPPLVRLLSVADVYDALRSERPYRAALEPAECLALMRRQATAGELDADLVQCLESVLPAAGTVPAAGNLGPRRLVPPKALG
jgi:putative two-component system response regulator